MIYSKQRVAVLRGGPSSEYEVSLESGKSVLNSLSDKYFPVDVHISKNGEWYMAGVERDPMRILNSVDVVFNAMHGQYGEDGQVQRLLESSGIPFTGSRSFASALAMNKLISKDLASKIPNLNLPKHVVINVRDNIPLKIKEVFNTMPAPYILKPFRSGSSVGVFLATHIDELREILETIITEYQKVIVEEYIGGREFTCGVLENYRDEDIYPLLPVEIIYPEGKKVFDYDAKYSGESEEICPCNITENKRLLVENSAKSIHQLLGLSHYSRSDFIMNKRGDLYYLETNTLPGLTNESLLPKSLNAVGCSMSDFLDHVIDLSMNST